MLSQKIRLLGIYFNFGNILAQTTDLEAALQSYEAAREYGFESELMEERTAEFKALIRTGKIKAFVKEELIIIVALVVFLILVIMTLTAAFSLVVIMIRSRSNN